MCFMHFMTVFPTELSHIRMLIAICVIIYLTGGLIRKVFNLLSNQLRSRRPKNHLSATWSILRPPTKTTLPYREVLMTLVQWSAPLQSSAVKKITEEYRTDDQSEMDQRYNLKHFQHLPTIYVSKYFELRRYLVVLPSKIMAQIWWWKAGPLCRPVLYRRATHGAQSTVCGLCSVWCRAVYSEQRSVQCRFRL